MNTKANQQPIITDQLKEQILAVRDTGRMNMFFGRGGPKKRAVSCQGLI